MGLAALKNIGICYNFADNDKSFSGETLSKVILRQNTDKKRVLGQVFQLCVKKPFTSLFFSFLFLPKLSFGVAFIEKWTV